MHQFTFLPILYRGSLFSPPSTTLVVSCLFDSHPNRCEVISYFDLHFPDEAFLVAQPVKNLLQYRRPRFDSWVGKIPWQRDRPPTPVFFGFPGGSAGKETACNVGDLRSIPGLGRTPGEGNGWLPTPIFWPGEFWGHKELDTTEQLSLSLSGMYT